MGVPEWATGLITFVGSGAFLTALGMVLKAVFGKSGGPEISPQEAQQANAAVEAAKQGVPVAGSEAWLQVVSDLKQSFDNKLEEQRVKHEADMAAQQARFDEKLKTVAENSRRAWVAFTMTFDYTTTLREAMLKKGQEPPPIPVEILEFRNTVPKE